MSRDGGMPPNDKAPAGSTDPDFGRRLDQVRARHAEQDRSRDAAAASARADGSSLGRAMRLSSEFVGGIVAGAGLGWLADRFLGTSPWGLIILLMLGFAAGVLNVMRASGFLGAKRSPFDGRKD